jgi:hypothetical protein
VASLGSPEWYGERASADQERGGGPERTPGAELTRRRLLQLGLSAAAAGGLGSLGATATSVAAPRRSGAPVQIDPHHFPSTARFRHWQRQLDDLGLRATGTRVHEDYIDLLRHRLHSAGVKDLRTEPVPFKRWTTESWKLEIVGGTRAGPVETASYIPYTGQTPPSGVTGQLAVVQEAPAPGSLAGKVAIFDIPLATITYAVFQAIAYKTYDPNGELAPDGLYARSWLGIGGIIAMLDALGQSGAVGAIGVLDLPADAAHGAYYPYDGAIRKVPGVYVDRDTGAQLKQLAAAGASARVTVPSQIVDTTSRNLIGVIPGDSEELMILQSHTDGTNGIEDNGPDAIVAMSRYLARLPRKALPRTVLVALTTGHFIGAAGTKSFVASHLDDLIPRAAAALTLEHLGAREWNPGPDGHFQLTGKLEPGAVFTPPNSFLVDGCFAALERAGAAPSSVLRPYVPDPESPTGKTGWPADGTALWTRGSVPTANFITGPTYLLNWGIPTTDKFDAELARREATEFTRLLLELSSVPRDQLAQLDL